MSVSNKAIGVISPQFSGDYFGILLDGVIAATHERHPRLIALQNSPGDVFHSGLAHNNVAGWIVIGDTTGLTQFTPAGTPLVTLGVIAPQHAYSAISPDNTGGMRTAVLHLIGHGHTRIGFIGNLAHPDVQQRYEGYLGALAEHQLPFDAALVVTTNNHSEQSGAEAMRHLLATNQKCTAIVGGTDETALGAMTAIQAAGYQVPNDIAVVGFDDILLAHTSTPPLTTTRVPIQALGSTAAKQLLSIIAGNNPPTSVIYVETALIPRQSCGCNPTILAASSTEEPHANWEQVLEDQFLHFIRFPRLPDPAVHLDQIWAGGSLLIKALADVAQGATPPSSAILYQAWRSLVDITENLEVLQATLQAWEHAAQQQIKQFSEDATIQTNINLLTQRVRLELMRARIALETMYIRSYATLVHQNHHISLTLLAENSGDAHQLAWLHHTPLRWGCLGLWDTTDADKDTLTIAGIYQQPSAQPAHQSIGTRCAAAEFPLLSLLPDNLPLDDIIVLLPIRTAHHDYGILALACPTTYLRASGNHDVLTALATLLSAALERTTLSTSVQSAYKREQELADIVHELGSPLIPLMPGVILVPLVGAINANRAQQIIESILHGVSSQQADTVLIDITGVPLVDTQVANSLIQAARAAILLGARVTLVGVRPEIAQSIVGLGVELHGINTQPTLAAAARNLLKSRPQ